MSTPEGNVKKDIKKWMSNNLSEAWGWMPVKAVYGIGGIPDFVYSVPVEITQEMVGSTVGLFVGIEAKSSKGIQSPGQKERELDIKNAAGIYLTVKGCHNVEPTLSSLRLLTMPKKQEGHIIKINDRFSMERDQYNWICYENIPSKDKEGKPSIKVKKSYHPNLQSISNYIINKKLGDCTSLEEIKKLLTVTIKIFHKHLTNESISR